MKITSTPFDKLDLKSLDGDALVLAVRPEGNTSQATQQANQQLNGLFDKLRESGEFKAEAEECLVVVAPREFQLKQLVLVGLGDAPLSRCLASRVSGIAAKTLAAKPRELVLFGFDDWDSAAIEASVASVLTGSQGQDLHRSEKKLHPFAAAGWLSSEDVQSGIALGRAANLTRRLVNEPPSLMNPEAFAREAEQVATSAKTTLEVWDQARLEQERCGALLAVARGSSAEPRLVILNYRGGSEDQPTLALVGKGVTFDSGGLSLKPSDAMKAMKCDMAGAATVLGAMQAIAELELPVNVSGYMGLVENMVSGDSYKLGDVLTSRNGKTIEVLNTDAEGRLVLADVLDVAVERGADHLVDLATLTGACLVALGTDVAGAMTNDQAWCQTVMESCRAWGEQVWQLPMYAEFGKQIQSEVADIKNVGEGRWGGAITAAKLLEEFVQQRPWTHLDIAGPAFYERAKPWLDAGGSGCYVRALVELARNYPVST